MNPAFQSGDARRSPIASPLPAPLPPCHALRVVTRPLTLWLLGDGKAGHENQALGLAEALGRVTPCAIHRISLAGARGLIGRLRAACAAAAGLPDPDLIVAAGHATHPALLWLARRQRAKSIVLMRPSLPLGWFDLCIAPAHDFPPGTRKRPNLLLTCGALNRVAPPDSSDRTGRMILVGGPSAAHGWDGDALLQAIQQISGSGGWQLADSRRTPAGFVEAIRQRLPAIQVVPHQQTTSDWLPGQLAAAAEVWVTEDSVSMIYEALSSGAKVGLLPAPRLKSSSRVLRGLDDLIARQALTPFASWLTTRTLDFPSEPLREADRCATEVLRRLLPRHRAMTALTDQSPPDHILVIKLGALGDVILAMDSFHAIRQRHPGARITLLTRKPFVALTGKMPWFDTVWTDPAPKLLQLRKWLAFRRQLRAAHFTRVYDLQCNDRSGFYFRLLGTNRPEWCGVARGCSHPRADFGGENLPVSERLSRLLESAGVARAGAADLSWLDGRLDELALPARFVLLVPGCAPQHPYKRWPAEHYAGLVGQLATQGLAAIAIGTAVDHDAIAEIQAQAPSLVNLAGRTDIGQVAALARRAEAVVGNDTGPVHITGIVGAPTLVLMSRVTDPVRMLPRGPHVSWLKKDDLADLTVEEVFAALPRR